MKILILMLFLSLTMCMNVSAQTLLQTPENGVEQEQVNTEETTTPNKGLFKRLWGKTKEGVVTLLFGLVIGFFLTKTRGLWLKATAKRGAVVFTQVGELFESLAALSTTVETSIHDNGKFKENSAKEVLAAGKQVLVELDDVVISIKPKV